MHWGGRDSPSPQHPPPPPPAYGYGARLWQSPAAALRPARRPSSTKGSCPPFVIRHFTLGALRVLRVSMAKYLRIICAGRPTFGSVAPRQSKSVQVSPSQSKSVQVSPSQSNHAFGSGDGPSPQHPPPTAMDRGCGKAQPQHSILPGAPAQRKASGPPHSSFVIRHFPLGVLCVHLWLKKGFGNQSNPVQPSQTMHTGKRTATPDGIVPQFEPHYHRPGGEAPVESRKRYELSA